MPFTVSRGSGQAAGVYKIDFPVDRPYPNANYVLNLTNEAIGPCKVWEFTRPSTTGFHLVSYSATNTPIDSIIHFSMLAL